MKILTKMFPLLVLILLTRDFHPTEAREGCYPPEMSNAELTPDLGFYEERYRPTTDVMVKCTGESALVDAKEGKFSDRKYFVITCKGDDEWVGLHYKCEIITCTNPGPPKNGDFAPDIKVIPFNKIVKWTCDEGYELVGASSGTCGINGKLDKDVPTCKLLTEEQDLDDYIQPTCSPPEDIPNGEYTPRRDEYEVGDKVYWTCAEGYKLIKHPKGQTKCGPRRINDPDGVRFEYIWWYYHKCVVITCRNPGPPSNGSVQPEQKVIRYNNAIKWTCDEGYELIGASSATCQLDGKFDKDVPKCKLITCENPGAPENGEVEPTDSVIPYGKTIKWTCNKCYGPRGSLIARCRGNGKFDKEVPTCKLVTCTVPKANKYGYVAPSFGSEIKCGEKVKWSCIRFFDLRDQASEAECLDTGKLSKPVPQCERTPRCRPPSARPDTIHTPYKQYYLVGETINYECDNTERPGKLEGTVIDKCELVEGKAKWKGPGAICTYDDSENISCPCKNPLPPNNGGVEPEEKVICYNRTITWDCDKGYELVGASSGTCQSNGEFDKDVPTCKLKTKDTDLDDNLLPTCSPPEDIPNGEYTPRRDEYEVGDEVYWTCAEGYKLMKHPKGQTKCGPRRINDPDGVRFEFVWWYYHKCVEITCRNPGPPSNGGVEPEEEVIRYNNTIKWTCDEGYELIGASSATCRSNSKFDKDVPKCKLITCINPGAPDNGAVKPATSPIAFSKTIRWRCDEGYELIGATSATCQLNGEFDKAVPECKLITCKNPGAPENGEVEPTDPVIPYGGTIKWICNECYGPRGSLIATCRGNGKFDKEVPKCKLVTCTVPKANKYGYVAPKSGSVIKCGEKVKWSCIRFFDLRDQASEAVCLDTGKLSKPVPQCKRTPRCRPPVVMPDTIYTPYKQYYLIGDKIEYKCENTERPGELEGTVIDECVVVEGKAKWKGPGATCIYDYGEDIILY